MVHLLHQRQHAADFAFGKPLARKPVEIVSGQVGNQAAFVFAVGHDASDEELEVFGGHDGLVQLACVVNSLRGKGSCTRTTGEACPNRLKSHEGNGRLVSTGQIVEPFRSCTEFPVCVVVQTLRGTPVRILETNYAPPQASYRKRCNKAENQ